MAIDAVLKTDPTAEELAAAWKRAFLTAKRSAGLGELDPILEDNMRDVYAKANAEAGALVMMKTSEWAERAHEHVLRAARTVAPRGARISPASALKLPASFVQDYFALRGLALPPKAPLDARWVAALKREGLRLLGSPLVPSSIDRNDATLPWEVRKRLAEDGAYRLIDGAAGGSPYYATVSQDRDDPRAIAEVHFFRLDGLFAGEAFVQWDTKEIRWMDDKHPYGKTLRLAEPLPRQRR